MTRMSHCPLARTTYSLVDIYKWFRIKCCQQNGCRLSRHVTSRHVTSRHVTSL
jgi:hypothetical protein